MGQMPITSRIFLFRPVLPAILLLAQAVLASPAPAASDIPVPSKRPAVDNGAESKPEPASTDPAATDKEVAADMPPIDESILQECEQHMRALGIHFTRQQPVRGENGCGIAAPYEITTVADTVAISPPAVIACETAIALAGWVKAAALPYARQLPGEPSLSGLQNASGYVCRGRNNNPEAKLSEHALGRAIDISAFLFEDGSRIAIEPRQRTGKPQEAYQKAARFAACLHFTTVLGPYSDANHNDHLHLDIAERRGGYRLCDFPDLPDAGGKKIE